MGLREEMSGFKPEKQTDEGGFEPFRAKGRFMIDKAMIEHKTTEKFDGNIFSIALTMVDHPEFSGRKLWQTYFLENPNSVKSLANMLFTCGLEILPKATITDDELYEAELLGNLEQAAGKFVEMILQVSAWPAKAKVNVDGEWVTKEPVELVQRFKVLGEAKEGEATATSGKAPF